MHDEVVSWVKTLQKKIGEEADKLLEDANLMLTDNTENVQFVCSSVFKDSIQKDKIGYLKLQEFNPKDLMLRTESKIGNLHVGSKITCQVVSTNKEITEKELTMTVMLDKRKIDVSRPTWTSLMFSADVEGSYTVSVTWRDQHVSGSPLEIPITADVAGKLAELGLESNTSNSKVIISLLLKSIAHDKK